VDAVLKVYKKVRMYAVSGFAPKPKKIADFRSKHYTLGTKVTLGAKPNFIILKSY